MSMEELAKSRITQCPSNLREDSGYGENEIINLKRSQSKSGEQRNCDEVEHTEFHLQIVIV